MEQREERERQAVSRRRLIQGAGLVILPATLSSTGRPAQAAQAPAAAAGGAPETTPAGLIVRGKAPDNLEFPFHNLRDFLISNEQFYVRNHFPQPNIAARDWRLRVEGLVRLPLLLSYEELTRFPSRTVPVLLECAGNNRSALVPKAKGVQWDRGAVGTAEWTGVPLSAVLERAGVRRDGVEVVLEGADEGEVEGPGRIRFARSVPLAKAREDVLLVYKMNGKELPASHGFPVRAVVPGWYGVSSVKWLSRIQVIDQPFRGFFQSVDYTYWDRSSGIPVQEPITELVVKSQIARPAPNERVNAGSLQRVFGAAWTGESDITKVEVTTDGGRTWGRARLLGQPVRHAWRLWEYQWTVPAAPGKHSLMARATDARGRQQVMERNPDLRNYVISHPLANEVEAR